MSQPRKSADPVSKLIALAIAAVPGLVGLYYLVALIAIIAGGEYDHGGSFVTFMAVSCLSAALAIVWAVVRTK